MLACTGKHRTVGDVSVCSLLSHGLCIYDTTLLFLYISDHNFTVHSHRLAEVYSIKYRYTYLIPDTKTWFSIPDLNPIE